ncbi:threonine/serine exporter family protein [Echinimonas agarilytica]|uniref:Threonine/serine exporter family protein n=1 Tax=Echinimonas agarilytica TaxID=1215918 RepID=A0AA41WAJ6_9GAMM|nr:threonine/serine exporter family protein [Echinimonas agarilytica]MCM2681302.1 threonine/serine exporter family protein [Echinimonas agarilytica]
MDESAHQNIVRLALWAGQLMLQHGADTELVETTTHRLCTALGADWADIAISANNIVISSVSQKKFLTKVRRVVDRGINLKVVCDVVGLTEMVERGVADTYMVEKRLRLLSDKPRKYNRWLVTFVVALSCACFCYLFGGGLQECAVTFTASLVGMVVRQSFAKHHINPLINFAVTAFVSTSVASLGVLFEWGEHPRIAMAATVLMLVPGLPSINAVSDAVEGHISVALARWTFATMLIMATGAGIMLAMTLTGVWSWI